MKYEIDGIEKGKTIKSVQIVNKATKFEVFSSTGCNTMKVIMVDYLDGTQDVFEFNEETLRRIQNKVSDQAQMFVSQQKEAFPLSFEVNVIFTFLGFLLASTALFVDGMIILGIISSVLSLVCGSNAVRLNNKNQSIRKHKIYVEKIMGNLEEYNEILKKENGLSKESNKELVNIINIDNKSVKELEYIGNKIERYNEIEGKSPKKKSL